MNTIYKYTHAQLAFQKKKKKKKKLLVMKINFNSKVITMKIILFQKIL